MSMLLVNLHYSAYFLKLFHKIHFSLEFMASYELKNYYFVNTKESNICMIIPRSSRQLSFS